MSAIVGSVPRLALYIGLLPGPVDCRSLNAEAALAQQVSPLQRVE